MRRIGQHYKAFCSWSYLWAIYGVMPLLMAVLGIYARLLARSWWPADSAGMLGTFIPIIYLVADAISDGMLFGGFCGRRVFGFRMLAGSAAGHRLVLDAAVVDMLRRLIWCAGFMLVVPLCGGAVVRQHFFWLWDIDRWWTTDVAVAVTAVIGLYAFVQAAALLLRFLKLEVAGFVAGSACILPYMSLRIFAPGYPFLTAGIAVVCAAAVSVLTLWSIERKMERTYYDA